MNEQSAFSNENQSINYDFENLILLLTIHANSVYKLLWWRIIKYWKDNNFSTLKIRYYLSVTWHIILFYTDGIYKSSVLYFMMITLGI